jgi:hypothetical protein
MQILRSADDADSAACQHSGNQTLVSLPITSVLPRSALQTNNSRMLQEVRSVPALRPGLPLHACMQHGLCVSRSVLWRMRCVCLTTGCLQLLLQAVGNAAASELLLTFVTMPPLVPPTWMRSWAVHSS